MPALPRMTSPKSATLSSPSVLRSHVGTTRASPVRPEMIVLFASITLLRHNGIEGLHDTVSACAIVPTGRGRCRGLNSGAREHVDIDEKAHDRDCSNAWHCAQRDVD